MKRTFRLAALVVAIPGIVGFLSGVGAQVPSLDPAQTVDIATGQMRFSLPLGVVRGINGNDFPITLNYGAGVRLHDEASPVGMGFGCMPGSITRKTVMVPDHSSSWWDDMSYLYGEIQLTTSVESWYRKLKTVIFAVSWVLGGTTIIGAIMNVVQMSTMIYSDYHPSTPSIGNYCAGGTHIPLYPLHPPIWYGFGSDVPASPGYSTGYFHGAKEDLPDIYIVNTPYICGEIVPIGDARDGHFRFKNISGGKEVGQQAVQVEMIADEANSVESFKITLADGTKLFFEDRMYGGASAEALSTEKDGVNTNEAVNTTSELSNGIQWLLSKVIFPDFHGDITNPSSIGNTGSWIEFKYTKNSYWFYIPGEGKTYVDKVPYSYQCGPNARHQSYDIYEHGGRHTADQIAEDMYLTSIATPNQYAEFTYTDDRKDDVWLKFNPTDNEGWVNYSSSDCDPSTNAEANRLKFYKGSGSRTQPDIKERSVLSDISIFKKKSTPSEAPVLCSRVHFTTGYYLRPSSFNSYVKDNTAAFIPQVGNPTGGCLTLKSLTFYGTKNERIGDIAFSYPTYNPRGWDKDKMSALNDQVPPADDPGRYWGYYLEEKDAWGYYCPSSLSYNDFNIAGSAARAIGSSGGVPYPDFPYAAAWSLQGVSFPNGMNIEWVYESNRYDRSNGADIGTLRYGGGIRVKTVKVNNGLNKKDSLSFFYTDNVGTFTETSSNSSGYTTSEPWDILNESDYRDTRPATKGGYYAPMMMGYEMVQVVKNYNPLAAIKAPYGYTVYEFTHAGTPTVEGYHPNGDKYGQIDSSWERGHLWRQTVKNSGNRVIAQTINKYSFVPQKSGSIIENVFDTLKQQNITGWARLDSTINITNGVKTIRRFYYEPASILSTQNVVMKFDAGGYFSPEIKIGTKPQSVTFCKTKKFGDPKVDDYIVVANYDSYMKSAYVAIGTDIVPANNPRGFDGQWTPWLDFRTAPLYQSSGYVLGCGFWKMDNNDIPDLVVVCGNRDEGRFFIVVLKDVEVVSDAMRYDNSNSTITIIHYPNTWRINSTYYAPFTSCAVVNLNNDVANKPDLLFLSGKYEGSYDVNVDGSSKERGFFCFTDFTQGVTNPDNYVPSKMFTLRGLKICVVDYEKDKISDDILVTGPDPKTGWLNDYTFAYTILKSISLDPVTHTVKFSTDSPIPFNDIFFTDKHAISTYGDCFYAGASYDVDYQKAHFVFFNTYVNGGDVNAIPELPIIQYTQVPYLADFDNQPNRIIETNSNDRQRITTSVPAFNHYPSMKAVHLLTLACQTKVYAGPEASGTILREYWWNVMGSSIDDIRSKFNSTPSGATELSSFECPNDIANNYCQRVSGYITVPTTGDYTFWIASDDNSELWLSTDENPLHAKKIAYVNEWTNSKEWTKYPTQQSVPIALVASKRYYIEALHLEKSGGDNLAVGWQGPGITGDAERPIPGSRLTPMPTPKNVLSSQVTTYSPNRGAGTWVPYQSFAWNESRNASGILPPFTEFVFPDGSTPDADPQPTNTHWKLLNTVEKYNSFSQPIQTRKPGKKTSSVAVCRNDIGLPIGSIDRSDFYESGVFTCDYDMNEPSWDPAYFSYFDNANGWEKSSGTIVDAPADRLHFGQKVLKIVNGQGAMRNFKIKPKTTYTASAWVYVESGSGEGFFLCAELRKGSPPTDPWPMRCFNIPDPPVDYKFSPKLTTTGGRWQLVKVQMPAQPDPGSGNELWVRLTVGRLGKVFTAYVDDIRFYPDDPEKALISTTYYDTKWLQPVLSVDANDQPSQKVEYDGFGRPVNWYKIDRCNPATTQLVQSKSYHFMNDRFTPVAGKWYKIVAKANENFCIDIAGPAWQNDQPIHLWTYSGNNNQQWQFVATGDGYYNISSRGGTSFCIDDPYGNVTNGTQLQIWGGTGNNQRWELYDDGSGYVQIAAKASPSAYIDLENGSLTNGAKIQIFNNGFNTKWKLVEVP